MTAPDIVSIPNIKVAKPKRIIPVSFFFSPLRNMYIMMPTRARTGVKVVGLKSCKIPPPSIPLKLRIHAVTVVPTFAPRITLMACLSVIKPELTKPTTITVVAEEL